MSTAVQAPTRELTALAVAAGAYFVAVGLSIPTLPRYVTGPLDGNALGAGIAVAAFSVTAVAARPLVAPVAQRISGRALLAAAALLVGAGSALTAVAHSLAAVLVLRAVAGVGEAFFYVLLFATLLALSPAHRRGSLQSHFAALVYGAILVGPLVAETLRPAAGFTAVWVLGLGLCAVSAACALALPAAREPPTERRPAAIHRAALFPGLVLAATTWAGAAFSIYVALYAAHVGLGSADAPFAIFALVVIGSRTLGAPLLDRWHPLAVTVLALASAAVGLGLLAVAPTTGALLAGSAIIGLGQALAQPALMRFTVDRVPDGERTSAIATFTAFFDIAYATAAIVLGAVLAEAGYAGLYGVAAALSALAIAPVALSLTRKETVS